MALASYNMGYLTLPLGSVETVVDEAGDVAVLDGRLNNGGRKEGRGRKDREAHGHGHGHGHRESKGATVLNGDVRDWKGYWSVGTDAVRDVPLGGVCEVLYGEGRELDVVEVLD